MSMNHQNPQNSWEREQAKIDQQEKIWTYIARIALFIALTSLLLLLFSC